jgi:hypothetical protein
MKPRFISIAMFVVVANLLSAAPYITIGELKLFRAYASEKSKVELREYLPRGEAFDHWNRLASVRVFEDLKDPRQYLSNVAAAVKKSHPSANYRLLQDDKSKELVLDFLTFAPDSAPQHFAEWNLMRAKYVKGKGLIVYQYAMRLYVVDDSSIGVITSERKKMTRPFGEASFEEKEGPNQSPEPTSTAVMPDAGASVTPSALVAHL